MSPLLEVENLAIEFQTDAGVVEAARGVSLTLHEGEVLGLVGESGCGKSVTTMALMGLIRAPGRVTSGSIRYRGRELSRLSDKEWRSIRGNEIAMIFQDPMTSLNPFMAIGEQIVEVLECHTDLRPSEARKRAIEVMEAVGLPQPEKRLRAYPHEFSGGMRQRVMIAIALAARPKIILADEPTTALDVTIQAQFLDLLAELQEREGLSILLITHNLGVVANFCDRVHVMYAGQIIERAETYPLFDAPQHPYTRGLLDSVPHIHQPTHALQGIPGQPPLLIRPPEQCAFSPRCRYTQTDCLHSIPPEHTLDIQPARTVACFHPLAAQETT